MASEHQLRDKWAIDAVSALLLELRSEDVAAGLWEAGEVQWWWASDDSARIVMTLWADDDGRDIAYLMVFNGPDDENPAGESGEDEIEVDLGWLQSDDGYVRERILPSMLQRIEALPASEAAPVKMSADERDADLCRRLEEIGF